MKKFRLTMMCTACKWKISQELTKKGYSGFDIDMNTSILTFEENVNPERVMQTVNGIGYQIEEVAINEDLSEEQLALMEDALRNGYKG